MLQCSSLLTHTTISKAGAPAVGSQVLGKLSHLPDASKLPASGQFSIPEGNSFGLGNRFLSFSAIFYKTLTQNLSFENKSHEGEGMLQSFCEWMVWTIYLRGWEKDQRSSD